jgi:glycogen debranching enzyme
MLIAGSLLSAPTTPAGHVPLKNEPLERQNDQNLNMKRYVAAGDRAYIVGVQDGSQVPAVSLNPDGIGWHIKGQMGGVWAHPIKLLNQFQFFLNGELLPAATKFVSGEGYVRLELPPTGGLEISETQFAPDGLPVVLVGVQLRNSNQNVASFTLAIQAESELIPAYPWEGTTPTSESLHQPDLVSFDSTLGALQFFQTATQYGRVAFYALVSAALDPQDRQTGFQPLGATFPPNTSKHNGATGALSFQVNLKGKSSTTVWFAIAGSNVDKAEASGALMMGLASPDALLSDKISSRQKVLSQAQIQVPDADIQAAFDWGKLNLADMQRTVRDVMVRDTMEGTVYPTPLLPTFPILSGFGAGYPDYPWFFGTDGAYTIFSLSAVGQWEEAKNHLATLRQVSQLVNGPTGKVLHEIVTDGSIYFGTNAQNGDVNETAQFATAVATLWRWSGDNSVRDDNYDFIKAGLNYITTLLVTSGLNPDGWPEGAGIVEKTGMGAAKLDVAVDTIRALNDLAEMADSKGDTATRDSAAMKAGALTNKFRQDWWIPSIGLFADSLALSQMVPTDPPATVGTSPGYTQLQGLNWIDVAPMETNFALPGDAAMAFPQLESSTFTGPTGFFQQGRSLPAIKGDLEASAVNTGAVAIAEANYGRMEQSLRYVEFVVDELDVEQPGALPELFPSPDYKYFSGGNPFGGAMVMQAWSSYGIHWPLEELYLGIQPDAPKKSLAVVPDLPSSWKELSIDHLKVGSDQIAVSVKVAGINYVTTVSAPAGWKLTIGYTFPVNTQIKSVRLNNSLAAYHIVNTNRGEEIHVETNSGGTQEVRIQAK